VIIIGIRKFSHRILLSRSEVNSFSAVMSMGLKFQLFFLNTIKSVSNVLKNVRELERGLAIFHSRIYQNRLFGVIDVFALMACLQSKSDQQSYNKN